jgi:hypothetical protein
MSSYMAVLWRQSSTPARLMFMFAFAASNVAPFENRKTNLKSQAMRLRLHLAPATAARAGQRLA